MGLEQEPGTMGLEEIGSGQDPTAATAVRNDGDSDLNGLTENRNEYRGKSERTADPNQQPSRSPNQDLEPESSDQRNYHGSFTEDNNSKNNLFQEDCNEDVSTNVETLLLGEDRQFEPCKSETEILNKSKEDKCCESDSREYNSSKSKNNSITKDGLRYRKDKTSSKKFAVSDDDSDDLNKEKDNVSKERLIFGLVETPPTHYLIFFAIQQACLAISSPLGTTAIVAQAVCADKDLDLKVKILSSTMIMMGLSTFLMTTIGVKLPIFQGPSPGYIIPLIIMMSLEEFACPETFWATDPETNTSVLMAVLSGNRSDFMGGVAQSSASNSSVQVMTSASNVLQGDSVSASIVPNRDVSMARIQAYSGSLMVAGALHCALGLTGLLGVIARYVGPITIVPVMLLFGIYIHTVIVMFSETNWTVAALTAGTCIVLGLFLADRKTPLPVWTPGKGFRIVWTHTHQIFALLISLLVGWVISFFMTISGALSDDPESVQFNARTDARNQVIAQTGWFLLPYPGQYGAPGFSATALISFLMSTFLSILDSIGDYYATARAARAPPPPSYALNRGVAVEGAMSILSGCLGCGHATVSYSENIGAIGLSRVASRSVFQVVGAMYVFLAVLGKVAAVFVSIPDAVIGGSQIVTFGILIGVILSYLQVVDLKTSRNVSIIGITITLGMMLPYWINKSPPGTINTGNPSLDNVIIVCLSNPPFLGGIVAFILDNLVPGTLRERGIITDEALDGEPAPCELYVPADDLSDDLKDPSDAVEKDKALEESDDEVKVLVDHLKELDDDRYDVTENVYRINWIPNCMRMGIFAKIFPIFDKGLNF